jgi:hypothetical protein
MTTTTLRFALNTWQHLYSLQQAITQTDNLTGNRLLVNGIIRNEPLFDRHDMPISICFLQSASPPYRKTTDNRIIVGQLSRNDTLHADIPVDTNVFAELKKNLVEYIGLEGIHIVVTAGLILPANGWQQNTAADIVQLDYAMKGDGG